MKSTGEKKKSDPYKYKLGLLKIQFRKKGGTNFYASIQEDWESVSKNRS